MRARLLPLCRLQPGQVWTDPLNGHRVGCLDAADGRAVSDLMTGERAILAVHDPPYNLASFERRSISEYVDWARQWVQISQSALDSHASLYVWLGADQNDGFQPLPDFMHMMRSQAFRPRSFITMRNQRGYGTQKNWMAVRQELLYYVIGAPTFHVDAEYTEIPKILRGYYKKVNGRTTENIERGRSDTIRAGNVWVDIQQVFYRVEENVSGCYAQKPLKCIERILRASSNLDFHEGWRNSHRRGLLDRERGLSDAAADAAGGWRGPSPRGRLRRPSGGKAPPGRAVPLGAETCAGLRAGSD